MKLYLIKLGKAWHAIQRDGLWRASWRIFDAIKTSLRPVGKGDILFISGGVGDSATYRTTHVAEELEFNGFKCSVTVQDNPFLLRYVDKFSVFVFHRTLYVDRVQKMIEEIKKRDKAIIFDADDLVHDPKYLEYMDYYQKMNTLERKLYDNGVGGEILRDSYVEVATTTTSYLAEKLREEGKKVFIVPNKSSQKDVRNAEVAYEIAKKDPYRVRLGYFSGTTSHNKDFGTITDAITQILKKYPNVELLLVGPLDVESELIQVHQKKIIQLPYAPRKQHFLNIARCDINLAPLELENPFCEAKSELKFFEAALVRVPTVAVANQTYREVITEGEDGFTAKDTEEWVEKLSQLIENKELRENMGKKAYQKARRLYTTKRARNQEYIDFLREKVGELS